MKEQEGNLACQQFCLMLILPIHPDKSIAYWMVCSVKKSRWVCLRGLHCAEFHTCCNKTYLKKIHRDWRGFIVCCAAQSEKRLWCRALWLISRVCCHILLHNEPIKQWIIMASLFGLISNQICFRYKCLRPNLKRLNKSFFFPLCSFVETNTVLYGRLTVQKTFCIDCVRPTLTVCRPRGLCLERVPFLPVGCGHM